jgi:hypothetical protein
MERTLKVFKIVVTLLLTAVIVGQSFGTVFAAPQAIPSAYDLINEVNSLRSTYGVHTVSANSALMGSAQAHSEFQAAIGSWSHTGAGGTDETDRALAAGYGGGQSVVCDEAVAMASPGTSLQTVVYEIWGDYVHRDVVLLSTKYYEVGAGVFEKDGMVYYTVDLCVVGSGYGAKAPGSATGVAPVVDSSAPTQDPMANVIMAVATVTPNPDGAVIHRVEPGQSLWAIAIAYGTTIAELAQLNHTFSVENPNVMVGQDIIIGYANTATPTPTVTATQLPPTRTPQPTQTPRPTRIPPTKTLTPTATEASAVSIKPPLESVDDQTLGIGLVAISGVGLLVTAIFGFLRKKA